MNTVKRTSIWGALKNWVNRTSLPAPTVTGGFIEITPSGFISTNYVAYVSGKTEPTSCLPDGTRITSFANGETITESASGHLVHIDGHGKIVVVRILASDVKGKTAACSTDRSSLLSSSIEGGKTVIRASGVLKITRNDNAISVCMPNQTIVNLPLACA